jgi:hypothetical protein
MLLFNILVFHGNPNTWMLYGVRTIKKFKNYIYICSFALKTITMYLYFSVAI